MRRALDHWPESDLVAMRNDQPASGCPDDRMAAVESLRAFLIYTEKECLPANRYGMTLAGLRRMTSALQAPELKGHIWTWNIEKQRRRAAAKAAA